MEPTKLSFIYRLKKDHQFYMNDHTHQDMELVFYQKGNGTIKIDDKVYEFHDNCISVINPKTIHDERHNAPFEIIFMSFSFGHFHIPNGVYQPKNFAVLEKIAQQIFKEKNSPQYAFNPLISAKIDELMILFIRELNSYDFNERINDCMLYLNENFSKDIDIKQLAERYDIGYETFRHKFKKLYGMSPKNFVISKRLSKASSMLIESNLSCTEIAYECGFADSALLSKLFKQHFGVSPQQFKKNYKD